MIDSANRSRFLDDRQQDLQETLSAHAGALRIAADLRYEENLHLRLEKKTREHIAERTRAMILNLAESVDGAAEAVPDMSTYRGLVNRMYAEQHLDEELVRISFVRMLEDWERQNKAHWDYIYKQHTDPSSLGISYETKTEDFVFDHSRYELGKPIANLEQDEECRRLSLVLAEVGKVRGSIRRRILASLADTPAQVAYLLSVGGAAIGNIVSSAVALGGTACLQGGATYLSTRTMAKDLRQIEDDAKVTLWKHYIENPDCVGDNLRDAGIEKHPKKVLGLTE